MAAELAQRIVNTVTTTIQICGNHSQSHYSLLNAPQNCMVRSWVVDSKAIAQGYALNITMKDGSAAIAIAAWEVGFINLHGYILPYNGNDVKDIKDIRNS